MGNGYCCSRLFFSCRFKGPLYCWQNGILWDKWIVFGSVTKGILSGSSKASLFVHRPFFLSGHGPIIFEAVAAIECSEVSWGDQIAVCSVSFQPFVLSASAILDSLLVQNDFIDLEDRICLCCFGISVRNWFVTFLRLFLRHQGVSIWYLFLKFLSLILLLFRKDRISSVVFFF